MIIICHQNTAIPLASSGYMKKTETYRTKTEIRKFFHQQGVIYLGKTRVACEDLPCVQLDKSEYYRENMEEFRDLRERYGRDIKNGSMAPIYIRRINDKIGYGVFAAETIQEGGFIGEYAGVVQLAGDDSGEELAQGGYESDFTWYYLDEVEGMPELEISGRFEGNEMRFINHNNQPNVAVEHTLIYNQWIIFFRASRKINRHEQLLISYGEAYWEDGCRDLVTLNR